MNQCRGPFGRRLSRVWCAGLAWLALAAPTSADAPTSRLANPEQIASLIRDLGSDRFATREAASDRLARLGLPAFTALEEATRHADREIRFRAERILTTIRKNDLERRLAAFVAGTGDDDYQLPTWPRFSKGYGDTESSRQLFVEMQRAEPELLAALDRDPRSAVDVLGRRLAERGMAGARVLNVAPATATAGEVAAYLFVAAEEDASVSASTQNMLLSLCRTAGPAAAFRSPQQGDMHKKLLGGVIRRCDAEASLIAVAVALDLEMKEGLVPALKLIEQNQKLNAASAPALQAALTCVVTMGDASHVPTVEKLLENQTAVSTFSGIIVQDGQRVTVRKEMQVRDAALAALVLLTKQDMKSYYEETPVPRTSSRMSSIQPQVVGFEVGETGAKKRAAVLAKWAAYKASQQKSGEKAPGAAP